MRNINYFEITREDDQLPPSANLKLHSYDPYYNLVTVSHYGEQKRFTLSANMGIKRYNIPRKSLFLSFGFLFPM